MTDSIREDSKLVRDTDNGDKKEANTPEIPAAPSLSSGLEQEHSKQKSGPLILRSSHSHRTDMTEFSRFTIPFSEHWAENAYRRLWQPESAEISSDKELRNNSSDDTRRFRRLDTILYTIWMIILIVVIFEGTTDTRQRQRYASIFQKILRKGEATVKLQRFEELWPALYLIISELSQCVPLQSKHWKNLEISQTDRGDWQIGNIRIRQIRQPRKDCPTLLYTLLSNQSIDQGCYGYFSEDEKLETEFSKEGSWRRPAYLPWFLYESSADLREFPVSGSFAKYPTSGYVLDYTTACWNADTIDISVDTSVNSSSLSKSNVSIDQIFESRWVDLKTRSLIIEFVFYHPSADLFMMGTAPVELLATGMWVKTTQFNLISLSRRDNTILAFLLLLNIVLGGVNLIFELFMWRSHRQHLQLLLVLCTAALACSYSLIYSSLQLALQEVLSSDVNQSSMQSLDYLIQMEATIAAFALIAITMMTFKFFNFVSENSWGPIYHLKNFLGMSIDWIRTPSFLLLIGIAGSGVGIHLLRGVEDWSLSTPQSAMAAAMIAVFANAHISGWDGAFLLCWLFLSKIIFLNLLFSTLLQSLFEGNSRSPSDHENADGSVLTSSDSEQRGERFQGRDGNASVQNTDASQENKQQFTIKADPYIDTNVEGQQSDMPKRAAEENNSAAETPKHAESTTVQQQDDVAMFLACVGRIDACLEEAHQNLSQIQDLLEKIFPNPDKGYKTRIL